MTHTKPDFAKRQKKLRSMMEKQRLQAILTSDANDILYYTGYAGLKDDKLFMLLHAGGKPELVVSPLENDAGTRYPHVTYISDTKDFIALLKGYRSLGYNEKSLSLLLFQEMQKSLKARLEPVGGMLEAPRLAKDEYEIAQIKNAIGITEKALKKVGASLGEGGKSEKQVADAMEMEFMRRGVSEAFETIVCAGKNTAFVHHRPEEKKTKASDVFLVDTGCRFNGYCSDITRMFFGKLDSRQRKVYEDVKWIHDEVIDRLRAGVACKEIEELHRRMLEKRGYKVAHSFGHGIGLSVHEPAGDILEENAVVTVEPGVYIRGFGGFRVEDMIIIKKKGTEILSEAIPVL